MATVEVTKTVTTRRQVTQYEVEPDLRDIPQANKIYQTMTWQNMHAQDDLYPPTQGQFDDANTGGTPSGSRPATLNRELVDETSQRFTSTRTYRIREAMFPERVGARGQEGVMVTGMVVTHNPTAVQKLAEPAQKLKHAVINIINYEEDADVAAIAAPDLANILKDDRDPVSQQRAVQFVHQLGRKQASRLGLCTCEDLVRALVHLLETSNDNDLIPEVCAALNQIARSPQGASIILKCLTIPILVRMLGSPSDTVVFYALNILHSLMVQLEEARPEVRRCGGVQKMVEVMPSRNDPKFLTMLIDCLHILAFNNPETKLIILTVGGIPELIYILRNYNYEKLLFCTTRLLKVLSVCPSNKPKIVECEGMQALTPHLHSTSGRLMLECLWTLRNLSDQANQVPALDTLIRRLIQLLSSPNDHVTTCSAGCLCNLTCQNPSNKRVLVEEGGVEGLVRTLMDFIDREEVTEPVLCALRNATHRHDLDVTGRVEVRRHGGLPYLVQMMDRADKQLWWPLVKAITGLLRNLALDPDIRVELRDLGMVPKLCEVVLQAYMTAQENAKQRGSVVSMQSELSYVDGVRLEDMCELSLAALQAMARDPQSAMIILNTPSVLSVTVQMLYHTSEFLQRAASSVLCELSMDRDGAEAIEVEGATARLTELLHSRNEAVATFSAATLFRLSGNKPPEYRERLTQELQQSLIQGGVVDVTDVNYQPPLDTSREHDYPTIRSSTQQQYGPYDPNYSSEVGAPADGQYGYETGTGPRDGSAHGDRYNVSYQPYESLGRGQQQQQQQDGQWFPDTDL